jgi:hypothetical protein
MDPVCMPISHDYLGPNTEIMHFRSNYISTVIQHLHF